MSLARCKELLIVNISSLVENILYLGGIPTETICLLEYKCCVGICTLVTKSDHKPESGPD